VGTSGNGDVSLAEAPEWNPKRKMAVFKAINVNDTYGGRENHIRSPQVECRESRVRFRQSYALLFYNPLPRFAQREKSCFFSERSAVSFRKPAKKRLGNRD
jgi:hypothetical protein